MPSKGSEVDQINDLARAASDEAMRRQAIRTLQGAGHLSVMVLGAKETARVLRSMLEEVTDCVGD